MTSAEQEIRAVHSIWIDAVNAGDLARLLTLVAEDVVFLGPGQAPFGRERFSANFRTAHQQMRICCTSELEEVVVVGEVAFTRSRDALSVTPHAGGQATQFAGYRLTVYIASSATVAGCCPAMSTLCPPWPDTALEPTASAP